MIYIFYMFNDSAGIRFPFTIFLLRWLISFIIPFAFTAYYPASYFFAERMDFNIGGLILFDFLVFFSFP